MFASKVFLVNALVWVASLGVEGSPHRFKSRKEEHENMQHVPTSKRISLYFC